MASAATQHTPAIRVGGRRLSLPSRPKPPPPSEVAAPSPGEPADYPRPAPPSEEQHAHYEQDQVPPHTEEELPKKEKKQGNGMHDNERRLRESAQRKAEGNRPRKEIIGGGKTVGGGGRISQPGGKVMI
ncbi:hypothetical protein BV25DRAFT_1835595 [Artomyces pyxidatus]|uniref:Uncharacterized protein n=1 Tax=Artomyces pyxidatus TaxID=48021 RepID=A0ACB8TDT4_9AGAM|nr:hypothetical protein BV25DRAFT_1835595 [Artomyces pyxidatus]